MVLPLPGFVLHPYTAVGIAVVHVYLGVGHLWQLFGGDLEWTHIWKGFGALIGAYVFAALATRGLARRMGLNPASVDLLAAIPARRGQRRSSGA